LTDHLCAVMLCVGLEADAAGSLVHCSGYDYIHGGMGVQILFATCHFTKPWEVSTKYDDPRSSMAS
jgi:hypothetical protein